MHILLVKMKDFADLRADAPAQLERRAFAPGGAAEQMCNDSADKNQRGKQKRYAFVGADGINNMVCTGFIRYFADLIEQHNNHSSNGEQIQQPAVPCIQAGHKLNAFIKGRADEPAHSACKERNQYPFTKGDDVAAGRGRFSYKMYFKLCFIQKNHRINRIK